MAMIVRFFLKTNAAHVIAEVDVPIVPIPYPQAFDMISFMQSVRANGFFANPTVYIPHDAILCVMFGDEARFAKREDQREVHPARAGEVTPFPPRPVPPTTGDGK